MQTQLINDEKVLLSLKPASGPCVLLYFFVSKLYRLLAFFWVIALLLFMLYINPDALSYGDIHINWHAPIVHTILSLPGLVMSQPKLQLYILVGVGLLFVTSLMYIYSVLKSYNYTITTHRCILHYGFFGINRREIPLNKINDINMRSNCIEQCFGLGSVYLDTNNSNMSFSPRTRLSYNTLRLEALSISECENVMQVLGQAMNQKTTAPAAV